MDIGKWVIVHRLLKVDGVENLDGVAMLQKGVAALNHDAAFGLPFVKIKNQDAAANLKIASFRFFLDDFSQLAIQCVFCGRIKEDINVVRCLSVSHG